VKFGVFAVFLAAAVCVSPCALARQFRIYSDFSDRLTKEQKHAVLTVLKKEIAEAKREGWPGEQIEINVWPISLTKSRNRSIFVQIWNNRAWCASGGCWTWILSKKSVNWKSVTPNPFQSKEIAVERRYHGGHSIVTNWSRSYPAGQSICAHVVWNRGAYHEGNYNSWRYCRLPSSVEPTNRRHIRT
jgi:hypothetical protein